MAIDSKAELLVIASLLSNCVIDDIHPDYIHYLHKNHTVNIVDPAGEAASPFDLKCLRNFLWDFILLDYASAFSNLYLAAV